MEKIIKRLSIHFIIIMVLMVTTIVQQTKPDVSEATTSEVIAIEERVEERVTVPYSGSSTEVQEVQTIVDTEPEMEMYPYFTYSKDWSVEDEYLLAKIAMAEAEGETMYAKTFVILTVLNRVHSEQFPNTIEDVIFQQVNGMYQFSPVIPGGRWWTTEPNKECYEAVRFVREAIYDYSGGALYFEASTDGDNWHSRNLNFLYECGNTRFYK